MDRTHEIAWAAGFLDGEGCFQVARRRGRRYATVHFISVDASQVDAAPLLRLQQLFGGSIFDHMHHQNPNAAPAFRWKVCSKTAAAALRELMPFLCVKGEQARLLLSLQAELRPPSGSGLRIAEWEVERRDAIRAQVKVLNRRGVPKGPHLAPIGLEPHQIRLIEDAR